MDYHKSVARFWRIQVLLTTTLTIGILNPVAWGASSLLAKGRDHATSFRRRVGAETFRPENKIKVIVGEGMGVPNQSVIVNALSAIHGVEAIRPRELGRVPPLGRNWPRNAFVQIQNNLHKRAFLSEVHGGTILGGAEYVIASSAAKLSMENLFERHKITDIRAHYVRTQGNTRYGHDLDFFSLLLPRSKMLVVDTSFAAGIVDFGSLKNAADAEGLRLIPFDGRGEGNYPLNALVLTNAKSDVVFFDAKAKKLKQLLKTNHVNAVPLALPDDSLIGKIRCATNTAYGDHQIDNDLLKVYFP